MEDLDGFVKKKILLANDQSRSEEFRLNCKQSIEKEAITHFLTIGTIN